MRNLLFVESFNLRPSNQYILVRVIPSYFRLVKMCLWKGKHRDTPSFLNVLPRYSLGETGENQEYVQA
jgi:hypothetical protein